MSDFAIIEPVISFSLFSRENRKYLTCDLKTLSPITNGKSGRRTEHFLQSIIEHGARSACSSVAAGS